MFFKMLKVQDILMSPIVEEGNDVPVVPPGMTNVDIRELLYLARAMTTHVNRGVEPRTKAM